MRWTLFRTLCFSGWAKVRKNSVIEFQAACFLDVPVSEILWITSSNLHINQISFGVVYQTLPPECKSCKHDNISLEVHFSVMYYQLIQIHQYSTLFSVSLSQSFPFEGCHIGTYTIEEFTCAWILEICHMSSKILMLHVNYFWWMHLDATEIRFSWACMLSEVC